MKQVVMGFFEVDVIGLRPVHSFDRQGDMMRWDGQGYREIMMFLYLLYVETGETIEGLKSSNCTAFAVNRFARLHKTYWKILWNRVSF